VLQYARVNEDIYQMSEPTDVACFNRTNEELERFLLFCILVSGKTAAAQARLLHRFLYEMVTTIDGRFCARDDGRTAAQTRATDTETPFARIRFLAQHGILDEFVLTSKLEQYSKIERAFNQIAHKSINFRTCSIQELESVYGIGFKTNRFSWHTRPDQPYAILDTHILKYMRNDIVLANIPTNTPSKYKEYARLEKFFVNHCKSMGRSVDDLDLMIWKKYSRSATQNMDHALEQ
jgi:thermostable 8-oxoguanine DNA glycosylase